MVNPKKAAVNDVSKSQAQRLLEVAQTIALLSTLSDREKDQDVVTLSTLHASKGLEFPYVYMVGMEEGLLPHQTCIDEDNVEEKYPVLAKRFARR